MAGGAGALRASSFRHRTRYARVRLKAALTNWLRDRTAFAATARRIALALILLVALALRLRGLAFGLPALLDPDEPIFVLIGLKLLKEHTLDPGWFGHPGTTTIYAMALVEAGVFLLGHLTGRYPDTASFTRTLYHDPGIVFLPGRVVILASGLLTIYLTYRLARRLFGTRVALVSAALLAIDPIHIRYSQIIRTDMQATVFILLSLLAALRIADGRAGRRWRSARLSAGAWTGIACATKWPSVTVAVGVLGAETWQAWRAWRSSNAAKAGAGGKSAGAEAVGAVSITSRTLAGVALFVAATLIACVLVSPYLVLDYPTLLANLHGEERPFHLGATGNGFVRNVGWYIAGPLQAALGATGLVLALVGLVFAPRRRAAFGVVILPTAAALLASISAQHLIWERWTVPLLPLLTIPVAWTIVAAGGWVGARRPRLALPAGLALGLAATLAPLAVVDAQAAERATDTRRLASAWAVHHIPAGSTVAIEYLAFDVLNAPWQFLYPAGDRGCVDVRANLAGQVTVARIGGWRRSRPVVDFGGVTAREAPSCRADYVVLANYDRYLAERDRFPAEIAGYRRIVAGGRLVAVFRPQPGAVGGPVVRIVRLR